jgi:3-methylfumaryl-CoA hydratase
MSAEALTHGIATWIGRTRRATDDITAFPVNALAATLGHAPAGATDGTPVPPLWHWLYFLPLLRPEETRPDGHAKGDDFTPPIALPRRVWAGSTFFWKVGNPLRVGERATRLSRIESITPKPGRSGELVFVKVVHELHNPRGVSLIYEHRTAYRGAAKESSSVDADAARADTRAPWHRQLVPDAVLLFRFSALMFNAHRIHYDQAYATGQERYPALLVQGPLMAVLLLDLLRRENPQAAVRSLEFKAVRPAFIDRPLHLRGRPEGHAVHLWAADDEGRLTMTARAELEP